MSQAPELTKLRETQPPPTTRCIGLSGADFMVESSRRRFDYVAERASSFRGLHEAILNYGENTKPEILSCLHEEIAVAMAHGYAKIEGAHGRHCQGASACSTPRWRCTTPGATACRHLHGRQHHGGGQAIPGAESPHSAIDPSVIVRDFVKWDDQPASLQHFAESTVRAYKIATTPPMGPVMLSLDAELQENPISDAESLRIPKLVKVIPPQGDNAALNELGKMLVAAENPLIIAIAYRAPRPALPAWWSLPRRCNVPWSTTPDG